MDTPTFDKITKDQSSKLEDRISTIGGNLGLFTGVLLSHYINNTKTRLPASRSSSIGPEGCFSFLHPKVKVK